MGVFRVDLSRGLCQAMRLWALGGLGLPSRRLPDRGHHGGVANYVIGRSITLFSFSASSVFVSVIVCLAL